MLEGKRKIYYQEDMEFQYGRLTIERQLQMYEKHPDKNTRSATLWHAWHQNKSWLIRLLELTLASFPSYSRHDASHAEAVLHNIERILGENRIAELTATDCFAILHTVYVHDIGMAILAADREKIVKSDEFIEMIDMLSEGADKDLQKAALQVKKNIYYQEVNEEIDYEGMEYHEKKKYLYQEKLKTYYAVVQLLMEYQRKKHGEKASSSIKDWLLDGDKLRSEFSMSGVPMRIFFRIADCASLHTDWDFGHIMDLPAEENGYENDMLHPRFVAVLLQLGDALDIDNDRFHPFAEAFLGQLPAQSQAHYEKHLAIRTLKITPEEIQIEADCKSREAMRLIKNECDGIENLLKVASYNWSSIAPRGFSGALPAFHMPRLLLDGIEIPLDLAMARFKISQQKAFSILQGENIYSGYFPFVRELLQNAIDSTKIQCYEDYKTSPQLRFESNRDEIKSPSIVNISHIINPIQYPIEISIKCCKLPESGEFQVIGIKDIPQKESEKEKYGILFSIKDYGTGIDSKSLRTISSVGTSYKRRKKLLREIPDWLRPTGEFGIGLQSVFLVSDRFYCDTYVRNGERYRMEFLTGANGEKGYINIEPKDPETEPMAFGTEFQVFIEHDRKKVRNECMDAWTGFDPFADEYDSERIQRNIIALTVQILLDIDSQLEDLLFPVYAYVEFDLGEEQKEQMQSKLSQIVFEDLKTGGNYNEERLKQNVCWMYRNNGEKSINGNVISFDIENGVCMVDLWNMRVNLWLEDVSVNACIGVDYLVQERLQMTKSPCKLYYKGILIETRYIEKSGNLLEYIDIQGGRKGRKLIQLNRNGLTKEGEEYVNTIIIPKIYASLLKVLEMLARQEFKNDENDMVQEMSEKIRENIEKSLRKDQIVWQRQLVGVGLYYNFYMRKYEKDNLPYFSVKSQNEKKQWSQAIRYVERAIKDKGTQYMQEISGTVEAIEIYAGLKDNEFRVLDVENISIADFYDRDNKFAVVSKRRDKGDKWINSLLWLKGTKEGTDAEDDMKMPKPKLTEVLEEPIKERVQWDEKEQILEKWAEFLLENIGSVLEYQSVQQSDLVLELLQSVSIRACFVDVTGNLKIHILSGQSTGGVFYNINAKYRLLKQMSDRNLQTHAKRFAGNVWMGYEPLRVGSIQEDVCNIKEKYIDQNEDFMLMPCSGEAVTELIQFAEGMEKGEGDKKYTYISDMLLKTANMLDSCLMFEYRGEQEELLERQYGEYCKTEKVYLRKESFVRQLRNGYSFLLNMEFGNRQSDYTKKYEGIVSELPSIEEIEQTQNMHIVKTIGDIFPSPKEIQELRQNITREILENAKYIMKGEWFDVNRKEMQLFQCLERLIGYCCQWKCIWDYFEQQQMQTHMMRIKQRYWLNSRERQNLIAWTIRQIRNNQDIVEEYYDNIWNELENVIKYHRKGELFQNHQYRFLELLRM